ncbi:hypothetical protein AB0G32_10380 [Streptomyces sp. NPDC023723]|uniref:hypothetical protein n=1 Tax=Streptomyces sp. NPDC023723 TaxID=3154323 RepID=UPI003403C499
MRSERAKAVGRWVAGVGAVASVCWLPAGVAHADETHTGHRIGLINIGQIDDPMEDVLEHTLLFGDGYRWQ